ncbi:hypothetical protein [Rummeliibacillus pycnus]|uniref:hypothetical protein n=1 Tax=Rummeliibacillus pycnus TaxID=101070 RepID=UPI003D2DA2AC
MITTFFLLSACNNADKDNQKSKDKYDTSINQVITLENEKLKKENKMEINREEIGIVVYSDGELINLMYDYNKIKINSIYQKKKDEYVLLPNNQTTYTKIDEAGDSNYIENLGTK